MGNGAFTFKEPYISYWYEVLLSEVKNDTGMITVDAVVFGENVERDRIILELFNKSKKLISVKNIAKYR